MTVAEQNQERKGSGTPALVTHGCAFSVPVTQQKAEVQICVLNQDVFENVLPMPEVTPTHIARFRGVRERLVQLRQVRSRRRFDTGFLRQSRQNVVIGFAIVLSQSTAALRSIPASPPPRRPSSSRSGPFRPAPAASRRTLPREYQGRSGSVSAILSNSLRHRPGQPNTQTLTQVQRVRTALCAPPFRIQSLEVAHHLHPDVHPQHNYRRIELLASVLDEPVELLLFQNTVHPFLENLVTGAWQILYRDPERILSTFFPSQCHTAFSSVQSLRNAARGGPFYVMKIRLYPPVASR